MVGSLKFLNIGGGGSVRRKNGGEFGVLKYAWMKMCEDRKTVNFAKLCWHHSSADHMLAPLALERGKI